MKPIRFGVLFLMAGVMPWSCSSTHPVIVNTRLVETRSLKQHCEENAIGVSEVGTADSLVALAETRNQEGKGREAYWLSACAAAYYRLAIQKHEFELSRKEVAALKKDLAAAEKDVRTYGEVVRELQNMRVP